MYFSGPDLNLGDRYEDEFLPAYSEVSGEEDPIAPYHAHGYDAANIIFDAIEAVGIEGDDGTLYIPKDALRDYIAEPDRLRRPDRHADLRRVRRLWRRVRLDRPAQRW